MKVLITGAGGIGRLTADALRAQGDSVVVVDVVQQPSTLPEGVGFQQCDVTDFDQLCSIIAAEQVTDVVHTAAMLSTAIRADPRNGYRVNTLGAANVLEAARIQGIRRVVLASSTTVEYSTFAHHRGASIEEDFALRALRDRPASIYVAAKIAIEHLGLLYHDLYGLDTVSLRYGAIVSPWPVDKPTSVPDRLLKTLLDGGRGGTPVVLDDPFLVWDGREEFVDARDCAAANVAALRAGEPSLAQRVYNVAGPQWYSLPEVIDTVRGFFPQLTIDVCAKAQGGFAGFPYLRPARSASSAARDELGFVPAHDLADTVRACLGVSRTT